ncbi:hypothetical protein LTR05_002503 [Lithohypha guttulata]|uniref:SnoaL-like domain-containing protein n=1 Tax=Lithohypha guttulata TaxID=1690604 RepID=A0AAN7T2D4_9EURO|nr:hypothetical protein LTR05_002503 [Lithohypha guttulata]
MNLTEEAIARSHITKVIHRYARLARENCDWDGIAKCFETDGIYRLPDRRILSPSQAREVVRGKEAAFIRHHLTTVDIEFTSEEEAHSQAQFFATTEYEFADHWGYWEDTFRRQKDGTWLIHERTIVTEGHHPEGWSAKVYGGDALKMAGDKGGKEK